jgi:hypothetical protein
VFRCSRCVTSAGGFETADYVENIPHKLDKRKDKFRHGFWCYVQLFASVIERELLSLSILLSNNLGSPLIRSLAASHKYNRIQYDFDNGLPETFVFCNYIGGLQVL